MQELPTWLEELGYPSIQLQHSVNPSKSRVPETGEYMDEKIPLERYFDDFSMSFVEKYYGKDVELFGFERPF
ncbi:hypothetical protein GCM10007100_37500 [Roseibacillus persicicus]|uniref:Uncharacterized protein n=2 Tax=Roseibacillus persicicus TaxID=454148 RepID=A0A918TZP8_9BACT|nr:hypothetical protein GCM10007100_37500 [Roseibacillus persicicus]